MVWHPEKEEVLGFILLKFFYPFLNDPLCVEMICWLLDVWNFSALLLSVSSFLFHCRYARGHVSVINQATFSVNGALLRLLACDLIYFFCKHVSIAPHSFVFEANFLSTDPFSSCSGHLHDHTFTIIS